MTYEQIKNKEIELIDIQNKYKKEIEEMKWKYIKETYDIEKGNILKYLNKYYVANSIKLFSTSLIAIGSSNIKKDSTIGKNEAYVYLREATKEFNSYEEYKRYLESL
jgi:arginine deiminase